MKKYLVEWGELSATVIAENEDDAWSLFVGSSGDSLPYKLPKLFERMIEEIPLVDFADYP